MRGEFIRNDYQLFYVHNILLLTADRVRLGATAGEWYGMDGGEGRKWSRRPTDRPTTGPNNNNNKSNDKAQYILLLHSRWIERERETYGGMNTYIIIYTCIHGDALYRMMLNEYTRVGIGIQRCRARRHAMFYLLSVLLLFIVFRFVGAQWHIHSRPFTHYWIFIYK